MTNSGMPSRPRRPRGARTIHAAIAALLVATAQAAPASAAGEGARFVAHEARYDLSVLELHSANKGSAHGVLLFRAARTCAGWDVATHLEVELSLDSEGTIALSDAREFTETMTNGADGGSRGTLTFDVRQHVNGQPVSRYAGEAERGPDGGRARFTAPKETTVALPPDVRFVVSGFIRSLRALFDDGDRMIAQPIFDGSMTVPFRTVDLAAGTPEPPSDDVEGDASLLSGRMKRIVTAVYDWSAADSEPVSTTVSDYLANGIATRMSLDVGPATLDAELAAVRALPAPDC